MSDQDLRDSLPDLQVIWNALVRRDTLPEYADVAVVGGCRDLGLAERAAELYHANTVHTIICSGYQPKSLDMTEAQLLADHCMKLGVPAKAIILEDKASNTGENIIFSAKIARDAKSVILVHKPYMSLRFLATAEAQWPMPQPDFYVTCQDISFDKYYEIHGLRNVAHKMLGDMKRMSSYAEEGYQTHQHISDEAVLAYQRLVSAGFETR